MAHNKNQARIVHRGTRAIISALALTGFAATALADGDRGLIRLQLGEVNRFIYQEPVPGSSPTTYQDTVPAYVQAFGYDGPGGCLLRWAELGNSPLVQLVAAGGVKDPTPGFGPTSIGAWDGPKGTPCTRVSHYAGESLRLALGDGTSHQVSLGGVFKANAFDRVDLDVEVKGDAHLMLTTKLAGVVTGVYQLRTGSSIDGSGLPPLADGQPPLSDLDHPVANCRARSDSGPDSGPNDNCRWRIRGTGNEFEITALAGEFSLEGGADWATAAERTANNSLIYLTYVVEGDLTCGSHDAVPTGGDVSRAECEVFGPPAAEACGYPTVHYFFRDVSGSRRGCELLKNSGAQVVASMQVTFPEEPRLSLAELATTGATTALFSDSSGATGSMQIGLCEGDILGRDTDNPTIALVLDGVTGVWSVPGVTDSVVPVAGKVQDAIPGNGVMDWACILEQTVEYRGTLAVPLMQVTERDLFWGDFSIIRH